MNDHDPASSTRTGTTARPLALIVVCGCLIGIVTFGVRTSFGLFNAPLSADLGWGREVFALAIAIQNLLWGIGQPLAGAVADRFGAVRVLVTGAVLYGLGVALMSVSSTPLMLHLSAGVLVGLGLAGASFAIVLAAFARLVPEHRRSWALGLATASGSLGQFLFAPLGQAFINAYGWSEALLLLAGFIVAVPFLALALTSDHGSAGASTEPEQTFLEALRQAFGHRSYILLLSGFFVCGFHVAFIATHLPPYLTDVGSSATLAAWALGLIGLFNVVGAYSSGVLGGRFSKRYLLSGIYLARSLAITLFVLVPVSAVSVIAFAAAMGLLWLSTVPLTSGLVAVMFGTRYMATLFGFVFFGHQVGAFAGAWLGGVLFTQTGSYEVVWWLSVGLGLFAALIHWPIEERRAEPLAAPVA